jgi:hypothetical protein
MPRLARDRPTNRTLLLAATGLVVGLATLGWVALRGGPALSTNLLDRLDELSIQARESTGVRGRVFPLLIDGLYQAFKGWCARALTAGQVVLGLLLTAMAYLAWRGDEVALWSMRTWAWWALALEGLDLIVTGGMDVASWLRFGYALALLRLVPHLPGPEPVAAP